MEERNKIKSKLTKSIVLVIILLSIYSASFIRGLQLKKYVLELKEGISNNAYLRTTSLLPKVCLLVSFPNSGTTFTLYAARGITKLDTGTNYRKEVKKTKGVPVYPEIMNGEIGGPYFTTARMERPKKYVLTKSHCTGYKSSGNIKSYTKNFTQFEKGCMSGKAKKIFRYDERIMPEKVVRLVRDPFDNIVSNFHHWKKTRMKKSGYIYRNFKTDVDRFKAYCRNKNKEFYKSLKKERTKIFMNETVREVMKDIPCIEKFFQYTQWHNNANYMTKKLNTLVIHYDDYETKYNETITKLLNFLEQDNLGGDDVVFARGKTYRDYYRIEQKRAVISFIEYLATPETIDLLTSYLTED